MQTSTAFENQVSPLSGRGWDLFCRAVAATFFIYLGVENGMSLGTFIRSSVEVDRFTFLATIAGKILIIAFLGLNCCLFVLRRRPVKKASGSVPRVTAFLGTFFFYLLAIPGGQPSFWQAAIGSLLLCGGTALAIYSLSELGRSFSVMAEARKLITTGPYAFVRHPMYLSEEIAIAGIVIQNLSPYAVALFTIHLWLQIQRMKHEESVLSQAFPEYEAHMNTRARLIPLLY